MKAFDTLRNKGGYVLLPVLMAFTMIAMIAFMINRSASVETGISRASGKSLQARHVAEAGLRHARWFLADSCNYRAPLTNNFFGENHTYTVTLTDNPDGTIHIESQGVLNGQSIDASIQYTSIILDDFTCIDEGQKAIYWADINYKAIRRVEFDGSGITDLVTDLVGVQAPKALDIDSDARKMYWGDKSKIYRADLDGSYMEEIIACEKPCPLCESCEISGLALYPDPDEDPDTDDGLLYYTDKKNHRVFQAGMDGSAITLLLDNGDGISFPRNIKLDLIEGDPNNRRFFFIDSDNNMIKNALLDGTDIQISESAVESTALAVNGDTNLLYYYNVGGKEIARVDYVGGGYTELIAHNESPEINGFDFDVDNGKIYYSYYRTGVTSKIIRANLADGSVVEDVVVTGADNQPWDIAIGPARISDVPRSKGVYWTEGEELIRRSEISGLNIQNLAINQIKAFFMEFEPVAEQLYWSADKKIIRSTASGGQVAVAIDCVAAGRGTIFGFAFDSANEQIYWVSQSEKAIYRGNLNGTNIVKLLSDPVVKKPWDLDLDLDNNKIYWVDEDLKELGRCNLDGSNPEILLRHADGDLVERPYAIAVDSLNDQVYWFEDETETIYRADLDGSGASPAIAGAVNIDRARSITLDIDEGKIYWSELEWKEIRRANLNGSDVEIVVDNLPAKPWGITVVPASE